jgi:prophage antirepressor-like protein
MSILRTSICKQLKRKKYFDKLAENLNLPRREIMQHILRNEEDNPLTKGNALRQIKKVLGVKENWQVLSQHRVLTDKEVLSFESIRRNIMDGDGKRIVVNAKDERLFTFVPSNQNVRVEMIDGEPWFVARDVCNILKLRILEAHLSDLNNTEKNIITIRRKLKKQGNYNVNVVSESGLYALISQSQEPEAKLFREWVMSEVLPALRRTGEKEVAHIESEQEQDDSSSLAKIEEQSNDGNDECLFTFAPSNQNIRVEMIDRKPWFVAKDVCDVLELQDTNMSLQKLDDDEKLTQKVFGSGQNRTMWFVNESGLYNLIFRSNKPEAKMFRKWVTSEVLPALRRTGEYQIKKRRNHNAPVPAYSTGAI